MWDANHDDKEEDFEDAFLDTSKTWAVSLIVPILIALVFISISVFSK